MASITARNLDDEVKACLQVRTAGNGRSMEEAGFLQDAVGLKGVDLEFVTP